MALLIVAVAAIGWSIQRTTFASHAVDLRIQNYRDHHEIQGIKAIVARWFREVQPPAKRRAEGESATPEYYAKLPNHTIITLRLTDGQGTILARLDNVPSIQTQELLLGALRSTPVDREDLIRRHGPPATSLVAAPPEVLLAFADDDPKLALALQAMQTDLPKDNGDFVRRLMAAGFPEQRARDLTLVLTMTPTLSRVDAEVTDELGTRRYALLVGQQDGLPRIYDCRRLVGMEEALAATTSDHR